MDDRFVNLGEEVILTLLWQSGASECVCVCVCVCVITVSVTRLCSPLGLELMVKLRTLLTVFTFILKAKARDYGKGRYISDSCLRCSANHNALCQLANQSRLRLSKGGTSKTKRLREAGHRGPTIMYSIWKIMCFFNIKACQHILLHQIHKIMIFKKASYDPFKTFWNGAAPVKVLYLFSESITSELYLRLSELHNSLCSGIHI